MKSFFKFILGTALVLGLLVVALGLMATVNVMTHDPGASFSLRINGADVPLDTLGAGHLVIGAMGLAVAAVVVVVVVPLSLLLGLALPLLMLGLALALGLLALLGVGALAMSPLLILLLPLIWLLRRKPR